MDQRAKHPLPDSFPPHDKLVRCVNTTKILVVQQVTHPDPLAALKALSPTSSRHTSRLAPSASCKNNMSHDEFHLFHALPPEIQDSVWELCLPKRVISPCYSSVLQEKVGRLPGTSHRTDMPVGALIPFRPPLISRVCRRARATALRCGQYASILVEEETDLISDGSVWLNKKSDWVYFNYHTMMNGLDDSGAAPQIFELARDVSVPLIIDSNIQGDHENPLHNISQDEETIGSRLYECFLRGREQFYYAMAEVTLVMTGKDYEHVVDTGLFGLLGEDMAVVPTADEELLQRYKSLYDMYDAREASYKSYVAAVQRGLNSLIKGYDQGTHEPRTLIGELLERICNKQGEIDVCVEDMMSGDGSLKPGHPLVERLGISMPICEPVVIFELQCLDALLEDTVTQLSWDSNDTTDTEDTTDTTGTESDGA